MVILHIIIDLKTGGAELMLKRLLAAQGVHSRYRHRVVSLGGLGSVGLDLRAMGIEVTALGMSSAHQAPATLLKLVRAIRDASPDIVQCWMYHADLLGGFAARLAGVRNVIWNVRASHITPEMGVAKATLHIRALCARLSRSLPSKIVYVAESARLVHEGLGYDARKSIVIPNGYCIPAEDVVAGREAIRGALRVSADSVLIGTAARYNPAKGFEGLIAATASVATNPKVHLVLIGPGVDSSNPDLIRSVTASGFAERIHLLGERQDILSCLAALDLFVLNSTAEGFPNVVAEAMSVAVPTIVTDVGDGALLVSDCGLVVPPSDGAALAAALRVMVNAGPGKRRSLGMAARKRIATHYSMDTILRRYETLYNETMAKTPTSDS